MKISISIEKKKSTMIEKAKGHNLRLHATKSQLPKPAWISAEGNRIIVDWREDLIEKALSLSKRKDAVIAVELTIQVGDQSEWREMPTPQNRFGAVKKNAKTELEKLVKGAKAGIEKEFGSHNIVSMVLHTDESSPHIHAIIVPIHDNKLQAKHWFGSPSKVGSMWSRLHKSMNEFMPCTYTPKSLKKAGEPLGGEAHDKTKRAGGKNDPKKAQNLMMSLYDKLKEKIKPDELKAWLMEKVEQLEKQLKDAFAKIKYLEKKNAELAKVAKDAEAMQSRAERNERASEAKRKEAEKQIEELKTALAEKKHIEQLELAAKRDSSGNMHLRELGRRAGLESKGPRMV